MWNTESGCVKLRAVTSEIHIRTPEERIAECLDFLYGPQTGAATREQAMKTIAKLGRRADGSAGPPPLWLDEKDAMLITYADQVREPDRPPLRTLREFLQSRLKSIVSAAHILPFFPYSSDDGFSVIDYLQVNPEFGSWADVEALAGEFKLMFDAVFNHMSAQSPWFRAYLNNDPEFRDFFIAVEGEPDLSSVVRPRTTPLLTEFASASGPRRVWTTFSADQADLNYKNPKVLLKMLEVLLEYVRRGARFIRLDAIAFLWKEIGTPCIHLPQTHAIIRFFRAALDIAAPEVLLITETNVPHKDNISYFGDGYTEAQLVYNFALPPLTLHSFLRGDATVLSQWARTLAAPSPRTTFFNFLASHDGVGLNPARGILPEEEIQFLVERCLAHGGYVSNKANPDGTESPYELNIVYFDALNDPGAEEPTEVQVNRFIASQCVMLALAGMPGIYFHSLFGSRNDRRAVEETGIKRRINRQKFPREQIEAELADPQSVRARVFSGYARMLRARRSRAAFAVNSPQAVLDGHPSVFAVLRGQAPRRVLCLQNTAGKEVEFPIPKPLRSSRLDILARHPDSGPSPGSGEAIRLEPYQVLWLEETP